MSDEYDLVERTTMKPPGDPSYRTAPVGQYAEAPNEPRDEKPSDNRRMDPELRVMGQMLRLLDDLDEMAKGRAVSWLWKRYSQDSLPGGS